MTDLVSLVDSFGLDTVIKQSTIITTQSSSCIDNIITNLKNDDYEAGVIKPCLSDHLDKIIIDETAANSPREVFRRRITNRGIVKLRASLLGLDWNLFSNNDYSIDFLSNFLVNNYKYLVYQHFPIKQCDRHNNKPIVSWFNESIRKMRDTPASVKIICNVTRNLNHLQIYKDLLKSYKHEINITKKAAYDQHIANSDNKPRDAWKLINYERNNNHSSKTQIDPSLPQDDFNNYFSTADNILASLPISDISDNNITTTVPVIASSFFLRPVTAYEVLDAVNALKNSPCTDVYDLNSKIIKNTIDIILGPFTILINR